MVLIGPACKILPILHGMGIGMPPQAPCRGFAGPLPAGGQLPAAPAGGSGVLRQAAPAGCSKDFVESFWIGDGAPPAGSDAGGDDAEPAGSDVEEARAELVSALRARRASLRSDGALAGGPRGPCGGAFFGYSFFCLLGIGATVGEPEVPWFEFRFGGFLYGVFVFRTVGQECALADAALRAGGGDPRVAGGRRRLEGGVRRGRGLPSRGATGGGRGRGAGEVWGGRALPARGHRLARGMGRPVGQPGLQAGDRGLGVADPRS
mmetsp:Transcript_99720/g.277722  ORF Transcript_99720/g.277722 Transcript_99720/m.277722 type:complete len:263 (-) Transcript_99720:351-1139(-)